MNKKEEALRKILDVLHDSAQKNSIEFGSPEWSDYVKRISAVLDELMVEVEGEAFNRGVLMYANSLSSTVRPLRAVSQEGSPSSSSSSSTSSYFKSVESLEDKKITDLRDKPKRIPAKIIAGTLPTIPEEDDEQFGLEFN